MYSIFRQETTGLWAVKDDDTGKVIGRGELPITAINFAIQKGMPAENSSSLLAEADDLIQQEEKAAEARAAEFKANAEQTPAQTAQQNNQYIASGGAQDDNPPPTQVLGDPATTESGTDEPQTTVDASPAAGTTVAGKSNTSTSGKQRPGKRLTNPLSNFSSYNYQLSLYMVTPDAYNAFILSGRKNINAFSNAFASSAAQQSFEQSPSGVYLVAQSGGINNDTSLRAPGFELDYYIDNLEINAAIAQGKSDDGEGPKNEVNIKFTITEPYGFSFISNLKKAVDEIYSYSSTLPNAELNTYADRQSYVLGIKFLGYDSRGNIVSGLEQSSGITIDSATSSNGSFETYYDIKINEIKFKLDGRAVTYQCTAVSYATQAAYGIVNGRVLTDTSAIGSTVENTIDDLVKNLNKAQSDLALNKGCEIPNKYKVVYIGPDADLLRYASTANPVVDSDKTKYPALTAVTTSDIDVSDSIKAGPKGNERQMTFKGGGATSIVQAMQLIITQSDYIQNAIKNLYKNQEYETDKNDYDTANQDTQKNIKWFNVSAEVINLGYDKLKKDWSYEITYVVQTYETPYVNVITAPNTTPYYGPSKRYEYWLTGKNSEVLNFELTYNQLYTQNVVGDMAGQENLNSTIPVMAGQRAAAPRQGKLGIAMEAQNAYVNYLNDPGAYANAKISIMGDPDWLVKDNSSSLNDIFSKFYGVDGYTINCNSGQVFIEVDFKEAVDYDNQTGVMSVNDKIMFFDYPKIYKEGPAKIQGMAFQVKSVISNFRAGKFTQQLDLQANVWATPNDTAGETSNPDTSYDTVENNRLRRLGPPATGNTGLKSEPSVNPSQAPTGTGAPVNNETTNAYADDDR